MNRMNLHNERLFTLNDVWYCIRRPDYKGLRNPTHDDYIKCIRIVKDYLSDLNISIPMFFKLVNAHEIRSIVFKFKKEVLLIHNYDKSEGFELSDVGKSRIMELCRIKGLL